MWFDLAKFQFLGSNSRGGGGIRKQRIAVAFEGGKFLSCRLYEEGAGGFHSQGIGLIGHVWGMAKYVLQFGYVKFEVEFGCCIRTGNPFRWSCICRLDFQCSYNSMREGFELRLRLQSKRDGSIGYQPVWIVASVSAGLECIMQY